MKKYIKPSAEIIAIRLESHILNPSLHDEEGDGIWMAPEYKEQKDINVNLWEEKW